MRPGGTIGVIVPFTEAEFAHLTKEMKPLLRPEFTAIAEVNGEEVGFIIALPDINVALQKIDGRLTTFGIPIGLIRLFIRKTTAEKGEANCDGRASRISSAWRRRDVGFADY